MRSRFRSDRGSVTAEFAAVIPAVLLILACCLGAIQVIGQQVRMTDAAADGARLLGRGESLGAAGSRVAQSVDGVELATDHNGDFVCLRLSAPASFGPAALVGVTITARGCALDGGR